MFPEFIMLKTGKSELMEKLIAAGKQGE